MSVKDYNVEPELNVSISGINIAEGCAPSGINNAIRQLMADVKEEREAQAQAVNGAKNEASSKVSALDSTLRALIAQEVAKCLKTSGGTLTGALYKDSGVFFTGLRDNAVHVLNGGTDYKKGSRIVLSGKDYEGWTGELQLEAHDGTNQNVLRLFPSGEASLTKGKILTSAGGTLFNKLVFSSQRVVEGANTAGMFFVSESLDSSKTASLGLFPISHSSAERRGAFELSAGNGTTSKRFSGHYANGLKWGSESVVTLVDSGSDSNSWYRKYSDGLIIQGGRVTGDTGGITFDIPFTSEDFAFVPGRSSSEENTGGFSLIAIPNGTTGVTLKYRNSNISDLKGGSWVKFSWIAVGY